MEFVIAPEYRIREVKVTGYDRSVLNFVFAAEKKDPPLAAGLFRFTAPPGTEMVESEP